MSNEIILETVRELLPDIEKEIREQIHQELQMEYQQLFTKEVEGLQNFDEQTLRKQLEKQLRSDFELQKEQLAQEVIQEFDESLQKGQLEQQLRFKIQEQMEEQINEEVQKKTKAIKLQFKKRLEIEKQQMTKDFELEWKHKVDAEKKRLDREKGEIARLKSVEYVKLKKIQEQQKKHSLFLQEQENKYKEITNSLQKQIQELTQQLEYLLQNQIQQETTSQQITQRFENLETDQKDKELQSSDIMDPIYQHKQLTDHDNDFELEQIQYFKQQQQQQQQQLKKQNEKTTYQKQLEKSLSHQQKQISNLEKENNSYKINKIDIILNQYQEKQQNEQFYGYNSLFKENDIDNTKNKTMKEKRKQIIDNFNNNQKLFSKYQALQINIMNEYIIDFIEQIEYKQIKQLLVEILQEFDKWLISYQFTIEFLKQIKIIGNKCFRDIIPFIQTQLHKFKLLSPHFSQFQHRFNLKNQIMQSFSQFSKCKHLFEELQQINNNLLDIQLNIQGNDFQEILQLDQWEKDYLEREELKQQILTKIQSKL